MAEATVDSKTTRTVTVACKIGLPWIDFEVCEEKTIMENTQTGAREVKQYFRTGKVVRIRGTAYPRGEPPEGFPEKPRMLLGYALTPGVDRATWETIAKQHERAAYFTSGMIRAFASEADIKSYAGDYVKELSGLEPVQRTKDDITDARIPRSVNGAVSTVAPARATAA